MAYQTYTTEAIVCGTFHRNTADCTYLLFTREAGMLYADARSAREERSRQRFGLQDFSHIRVSLVKGKAGWKIGSTEPKGNFYHRAANQSARGSVVLLIRSLRRFYHGEDPAPELFDYLQEVLIELGRDMEMRSFLETVAQVRMLQVLGYVNPADVPPELHTAQVSEIQGLYTESTAEKIQKILGSSTQVTHL